MVKRSLPIIFVIIISACNQAPENGVQKMDTVKIVKPKVNPIRDSIRNEPVASYSERTENPLNDWYFKVQLFETKNTFHYLVKLQFEEIRGSDTLKLPNFGFMPEPVIKKRG